MKKSGNKGNGTGTNTGTDASSDQTPSSDQSPPPSQNTGAASLTASVTPVVPEEVPTAKGKGTDPTVTPSDTPSDKGVATLSIAPSPPTDTASQKPKARPDFENSVVLVSNADLDGFREGDGDLMDKMVAHLNTLGVPAVRVIQTSHNVPPDKQHLIKTGELVHLSDRLTSEIEPQAVLQERLLAKLAKEYKGKNVTLYIGSRINVGPAGMDGKPTLAESGSLFTKEFIQQLQKQNVKVVVNCLEFDFFGRSTTELNRQAEMMRQQLFLADKIHFLNEYDQLGFSRTVAQLATDPHLRLHPAAEQHLRSTRGYNDLTADLVELGPKKLTALPEKGVFVSGIFTVDPFSDEFILAHKKGPKDTVADVLMHRPPNVMCFGLMRGAKGIDEAIQLGTMLQAEKQPNKVIIAGKLMGSFTLCQKMMKDIFQIEAPAELRGAMQEALNTHFGLEGKNKINLNKENGNKIFDKFFHGDYDSFNRFADTLYQNLGKKYPERGKNIELHFNVPEDRMRELAMECRYGIKLDHKGMGNNASTIVSCLGFYLPTFTSVGIVTGNDFREKGTHEVHGVPLGSVTTPHKYSRTVIMPKEGYFLDGDEPASGAISKQELKPENPSVQGIFNILTKETDETYYARLNELRDLHGNGVFDSRCVTIRLLNTVFTPLNNELLQARGVDVAQFKQFAVVPETFVPSAHSNPSLGLGSMSSASFKREPEVPAKPQPFNRKELSSQQRGWNCGDIALGVERHDLVHWLRLNGGNNELRALMAPEIRTAAMMTALIMNQQGGEEIADKGAKQKRLAELLEISAALGKEENAQVQQQINELLDGKKIDLGLERLALPRGMRTPALQALVNNYQDAHDNMLPAVRACNDALGRGEGNRMSLQELDEFFLSGANQGLHGPAHVAFALARAQHLTPHEQALNNYCSSEATFMNYAQQHYGAQQWMVYHPQSGGRDNSSIMDAVAMKEGVQVKVYVFRGGQYQLEHETAQYGAAGEVRHVLYNGVNHYIHLDVNDAYVGPPVGRVEPAKKAELEAAPKKLEAPEVSSESAPKRLASTATGTGTGVVQDNAPPDASKKPLTPATPEAEPRVSPALQEALRAVAERGGSEAVEDLLNTSRDIASRVRADVDQDRTDVRGTASQKPGGVSKGGGNTPQ